MAFFLVALLSIGFRGVEGQVGITNTSCTVAQANGTAMLTRIAVACTDNTDVATCGALFAGQPTDTTALFVGGAQAGAGYRPQALAPAPATSTCEDPGHISAAIKLCPKYCGFCCLTPDYNCPNTTPSPTPCSEVTPEMCTSPQWRPTLAQYCPASCGLCQAGGCVDAVTGCTNGESSICFTMPDFAAVNCQRTCNKCPTATTASPVTAGPVVPTASPGSCTTYIPDASTSCSTWATNGFCTNAGYSLADRKKYCATTCKLC